MTHTEFAEQMRRLSDAYGDKAYPTERLRLFWDKFKYRHLKVFEEAVSIAIASHLQPPLLDKMREALKMAQDKYPELVVDPYDGVRAELAEAQLKPNLCPKCENHGVIIATRKDKPGRYQESLVCHCYYGGVAKQLPMNRSLPDWLHYYDHYYVLDSDPLSEEKLKATAHISALPEGERMDALVKFMKEGMAMP